MNRTDWTVGVVAVVTLLSLGRSGFASQPLYDEEYRPQVHFSPQKNWMNDPNGLVYLNGEYHLFYQYNPFGEKWGHISWGHAVSPDLVHWQELPVALPETAKEMVFSGSIVWDAGNTSGLAPAGGAPLVAIFTGAGQPTGTPQNQQLAYSLDGGRTWVRYAHNPVLDLGLTQFRDPKVFWYAPSKMWVMAVVLSDRHQVAFFSSRNLKQWSHSSDFGPGGATDGAWECPDVFALPIEGHPNSVRWVLKVDVFKSHEAHGSGAQYFIGHFDGQRFTADADRVHWLDRGMDFYAASSWGNLPSSERRHIWVAWMSSHFYAQDVPTHPWRGVMSVPREVTLRYDGDTLTLAQTPIRELEVLRRHALHEEQVSMSAPPEGRSLRISRGRVLEMDVQLIPQTARECGLKVNVGPGEETRIGYDQLTQTLFVDRARSGRIPSRDFAVRQATSLPLKQGVLRLHLILDRSSVEVFANDGATVLTELLFPGPHSDGVELYAMGGEARWKDLDLWHLDSTWRPAQEASP